MTEEHPKNPMHKVTLQMILEYLVKEIGWRKLSDLIKIRCFYNEPTIKSSLKFLRRTPWARKEVEDLYIATKKKKG